MHLVLDSHDRWLGPLEHLSLRLHWRICTACRRFRVQSDSMRKALDRWRSYREE
ncbi:MAG: zf-HC2 domain-containing protein [Burkholderiales bacterium]|nr:zf-HC2 domain-containing protein [Burkholderiales bacterium]